MPRVTTVRFKNAQLYCVVCKHDKFIKRKAMLNTRLATFFDLDHLNDSGDAYVCVNCGYIHWFLPQNLLPKDTSSS